MTGLTKFEHLCHFTEVGCAARPNRLLLLRIPSNRRTANWHGLACGAPLFMNAELIARGFDPPLSPWAIVGSSSVLEQGYQVSEVVSFLGCHASNVSRALQKRGSET